MLDDDGYAEAEEEDLVRKRFVANWAPLVDGYKVSPTASGTSTADQDGRYRIP